MKLDTTAIIPLKVIFTNRLASNRTMKVP